MIADKNKLWREQCGMTQAEMVRQLSITRSGVNAWEMGLTTPSTHYIVELSRLFHVSADYLLDIPEYPFVSVDGLTDREIAAVVKIIECLQSSKK